MAQGTPGNTKDCNQLQEDGQYEILSPINGPDGFTDILIIVLAPLAKVRPDHVVQVCYDATGAALPEIRTYVTGSGWSAWAALAAGGGGGGGGTAAGTTFDASAIVSGVLPSFPLPLNIPDFPTWIAALGLSGTIDDVEGALSAGISIGLSAAHTAAQANSNATVIRAQRAPANTDGAGLDFTNATDFDQPNTYVIKFGSFWLDVGSGRNHLYVLCNAPAGGTGNVWKQLDN